MEGAGRRRGTNLEGDMADMVVRVGVRTSPEVLTVTLGQVVGATREGWMRGMVWSLQRLWRCKLK
jgi:hypothetical protein